MPSIQEIRQQYPQYNDLSDEQLAGSLHAKFYSDMPQEQFNQKIGLAPVQTGPNQLRSMVADDPNTTYGSFLPIKRNNETGQSSLALPEVARGMVRGTADLMDVMQGRYQPESSDSQIGGSLEQPLTPDAASTLLTVATMKPTGTPKTLRENYQPIGNAAIDNTGKSLRTFGRGVTARDTETLQDTASTMKKGAGSVYDQMRDVGAVYNPDKINRIVGSIDQAVSNPQFIAELNPKTLAIVNHIKSAGDSGALSLSDLDQYRRLLLRVGNSEDGLSAGSVKKAIDAEVNTSTGSDLLNGDVKGVSLLNKGRAEYAKASRFEDVSDILAKANGDPNKIKSGLTRFVSNDDNLQGFSPAEKMVLRKAADTGVGENILKALGKFGFDFSKGGTSNTVLPGLFALGGGGAAVAGSPLGLPAAMIAGGGTMARQAQKFIARGKAENALRTIEGR